jgi:hypothetical protein
MANVQYSTFQRKTSSAHKKQSHRASQKEFPPAVRHVIGERSGNGCERCYARPLAHVHHAVFRSQGHEYIFLLSKSPRYYYDYESIMEDAVNGDPTQPRGSIGVGEHRLNGGRRKQNEVGKRQYTKTTRGSPCL